MTVLVLGASGATGRELVAELLTRGESVRAVVRPGSEFPETLRQRTGLTLVRTEFLALPPAGITDLLAGCEAVASCLGHKLTLRGIYGQPRRLVTDSVRRIVETAVRDAAAPPIRFVLMNTTGNSNRDIPERVSFAERCVLALLRVALPPHVDNERAADFLRQEVGQHNPCLQWVVVRPDTLTNDARVSPYRIHPSPVRSAIFNAGKTSRVNVADFMAELLIDTRAWEQWRGQMPVIYNVEPEREHGI